MLSNDRESVDISQNKVRALTSAATPRFPAFSEGDMSQTGDKRLKAPLAEHLELPEVYFAAAVELPGFEDMVKGQECYAILVTLPDGYHRNLKASEIKDLQESLKPRPVPSNAELIVDTEIVRYLTNLVGVKAVLLSKFAAQVNAQRRTSNQLSCLVANIMSGDDSDAKTVVESLDNEQLIMIDASDVAKLSEDRFEQVAAYLDHTQEMSQNLIDDVAILLAINRTASKSIGEESLINVMRFRVATHRLIDDAVSKAMIMKYAMPHSLRQLSKSPFSSANVSIVRMFSTEHDLSTVVHNYAGDAYVTDLVADKVRYLESNLKMLYADHFVINANSSETFAILAYAMLQSIKLCHPGVTSKQLALYGVSRARIVSENLYVDSKEVIRLGNLNYLDNLVSEGHVFVDTDVIEEIVKFVEDQVPVVVFSLASLISFLKSGHHANASGLRNTVVKMLAALQSPLANDQNTVANLMSVGVYYGTHAGSMRLMYAKALVLASSGSTSMAITRRLVVTAPGSVSVVTGMLFLTALYRAGFFRIINRQKDFETFKQQTAIFLANAPYSAPYAEYMYGSGRPEDVDFKTKFQSWLPYCSSIAQVLPKSTLRLSKALTRDSSNASDNDIIGSVLAVAYGSAIATVAGRQMRDGVDKQLFIANER